MLGRKGARIKELENQLGKTQGQLREALRRADRDEMTGLLNKGAFERVLHRRVEEWIRDGRELQLLIIDCNNFKGINDTIGHAVGDAAIMYVADRLSKNSRSSTDVVARIGGDEFAILTNGADTAQFMRKLKASINGVDLVAIVSYTMGAAGIELTPERRQVLHALSISIGSASIDEAAKFLRAEKGAPVSHSDADALTTRIRQMADQAMYDDKRGGPDKT